MTPIWSVQDVRHRYGDVPALVDVTFEIHDGVTALVGSNGAGKTTLMNLLAGSLALQAGTCGPTSPTATSALMPQLFVAPRGIRVSEFLHYLGWLRKIAPRRRSALVPELLSAVGLEQHQHAKLASLSGGQQRRALLAATLMSDAQLVLLDEPTAGLDPEQRVRMRELVLSLAPERSVLISTHLMEDVAVLASNVVMLDEGVVVFNGSTAQLADIGRGIIDENSPLSPHEAAFLALRRSVA